MELRLAVTEGPPQRRIAALPAVYTQPQRLAPCDERLQHRRRVHARRYQDHIVVHVVLRLQVHLAPQPVVHRRRQGHHLLLALLHAQRHTPARLSLRCRQHHLVRQCPDGPLRHIPPVAVQQCPARRRGKELLEVAQDHAALPAIAAVVPHQRPFQPPVGELQALALLAGPVVVDHGGAVARREDKPAVYLLHLPVVHVGRVDGPDLASFHHGEVYRPPLRVPCAAFHKAAAPRRPHKQLRLKGLYAGFPPHAPAAVLSALVHPVEPGDVLYRAQRRHAPLPALLPPCLPSLIAPLPALRACHVVVSRQRRAVPPGVFSALPRHMKRR